MENTTADERVLAQIKELEKKFEAMGQDLSSYLDGLLYSDYLTYWDYIQLETLLSLQRPRTDFPDEKIFITYHQITELYFNLILGEQDQIISQRNKLTPELFSKHISRINRYFDHLIDSFDVMLEGMDQNQFMKFRMSLLPASGFQSAQYRKIEINSTKLFNLVSFHSRDVVSEEDELEEQYAHLYWKRGATELATGKKTLTLKQFEKKYTAEFLDQAKAVTDTNIYSIFQKQFSDNAEIAQLLRSYDHKANVLWPHVHLKATIQYLQKDAEVIKASGGTNWQKYLPARQQGIIFFPSLWSEKEQKDWGINLKLMD